MKTFLKLKFIAFIVTALLFTAYAKAQTTPAGAFNLNIGLEAADPTGNARIGSHFILGGTARLQYGLSNSFAITLTSGAYHLFSIKTYNSFGIIPVKAGIKAFFTPNLYFGAEAGVGFEQTDGGDGQTKLILSPGIGYACKRWDLGIRYENFSGNNNNYGLVGLRIAYGFGL